MTTVTSPTALPTQTHSKPSLPTFTTKNDLPSDSARVCTASRLRCKVSSQTHYGHYLPCSFQCYLTKFSSTRASWPCSWQ
jgi:hypothetical protein